MAGDDARVKCRRNSAGFYRLGDVVEEVFDSLKQKKIITKGTHKKGKAMAARRVKISVESIAQALMNNYGNQAAAGRVLGVGRGVINKRVKRSPVLQKVVAEAKEEGLDFAEDQLFKQIRQGNITAIIFYLKTQGRSRGYIERHAIEANNVLTHDDWIERLEKENTSDKPPAAICVDNKGRNERVHDSCGL